MTVSCRLGACWLYLGYSTTERVLSSVCEPWGSLSLFCFLLPHPRGYRTTDNTRELNIQGIRLCQSTKPFDCVSTLTTRLHHQYIYIYACHVYLAPGIPILDPKQCNDRRKNADSERYAMACGRQGISWVHCGRQGTS